MKTALITGACGLIGSECVKFFHEKGFNIIGVDDDSRAKFFGPDASTSHMLEVLKTLPNYRHYNINIKDYDGLVRELSNIPELDLIIHTAAQPSHDWAATNPFEDFNTNALGTLNMLELLRNYYPNAVFILTSTNKVYGDTPNYLQYEETATRYTPVVAYLRNYGISESMSIDNTKHSLFGVSKTYSDLITQEYGKYFNLKTGTFRGGCLTGSNHSGVKMHGFLSYLVKCAKAGETYYINGYKGKQVRDNIHANDVASAFYEFYKNPKPGEVYNIGGGIRSNCSILEAIAIIEELLQTTVKYEVLDTPRSGDHIWYITDMAKFQRDYPVWQQRYDLKMILKEMVDNI
jgi:CDP-paratose 2-epimerase